MFTRLLMLAFIVVVGIVAMGANVPQLGSIAAVGDAMVSGSGVNVPIIGVSHTEYLSLTGAINTTEAIGTYRKLVLASANTNTGTPGSEYQIESGKKFFVTHIKYANSAASATCGFDLGYGDVAVGANEGTTTAPTGAIVYGTGGVSISAPQFAFSSPATAGFGSMFEYVLGVSIPSGKYPFIYVDSCNDSMGVTVIGYLR